MFKNTADRYGLVSKLLHWVIALLILGLIGEGWYLVGLSYYDANQPRLLALHKTFGMLVLFLALARIGWFFASRPPDLTSALPRGQRLAAHGLQRLLLLAMLVLPVTGYLVVTSSDAPVDMFGLFQIPVLFAIDDSFRELCNRIHKYTAYGTLVLVLGHAGAALWHQFVTRDGMLARMIWK